MSVYSFLEEYEIIRLRNEEGLSFKKIGEFMNKSASAIERKLKRLTDKDYVQEQLEVSKNWRQEHPGYMAQKCRQWRANNPDYIPQYNYIENHPDYDAPRYDTEFLDKQDVWDRAQGYCEITGVSCGETKLNVHHLLSVKSNLDYWNNASTQERLNNIILIDKDLHVKYHQKYGFGNNTPDTFYEFIEQEGY